MSNYGKINTEKSAMMSHDILEKLTDLKKIYPSNIDFTDDFDINVIVIKISKGCTSSNIPFLKCRCCTEIIEFADIFNKQFEFLLLETPPINFMKLNDPFVYSTYSNRRFRVEIKPGFFDSCGFKTINNPGGGSLFGMSLPNNDQFEINPCKVTRLYNNIVETFYKILGVHHPGIVTSTPEYPIRMFNYYDDNDTLGGGLQITRKFRNKSKPKPKGKYNHSYSRKKYKKMRKYARSKKHHRRVTRRIGRR
jgi:hypothetical protein